MTTAFRQINGSDRDALSVSKISNPPKMDQYAVPVFPSVLEVDGCNAPAVLATVVTDVVVLASASPTIFRIVASEQSDA